MNSNKTSHFFRKHFTYRTERNDISTGIALFSLLISVLSLVASGYFSVKTIEFQVEANNIQKKYAEFERNAKIDELVTEYNKIRHTPINFDATDSEVEKKVAKRSEGILLTLNNLFMITRGMPEWDQYIQKESEWPLASLERRNEKIRCNILSSDFRSFIFDNKSNPIDQCIICNDINCEN